MGTGKADKDAALRGLRVYRASRLEALIGPLEALLDAWPPDDLLAPQHVLAAHPGIQRWLTRELARRRGAGDIVANLAVQLPGSWLDEQMQARLGSSAATLTPYRRESLRWAVLAALDDVDDARLRRYLAGADAHRRFQLADRIAAIYARYLVYRPDWLSAWERGRDTVPVRHFLAPLWRQLRRGFGAEHRGTLLNTLATQRRVAEPDARIEPPLHVFGLSHLPASELEVLCAEARHRLVCLYFPDPCVQYWAGLGDDRGRLSRLQHLGAGDDAERELQTLGHPLLAAWGRLGQHFGLALLEQAQDLVADVRDGDDDETAAAVSDRLSWLQQGIRLLRSDLPAPVSIDALRDASLRVHGCHTRVRELEVLRDAVLDALVADPTLKPGDIVVMAPDIAAYAPLLPAIFGPSGDARSELPWHCADLALRRAHPLFDAFLALLQMPRSRIEAAQVLDLLQVGAIRRALHLDDDGIDALRRWLDDARVAWGLDARARERMGLPAYSEHSFAWGLARLVAGHVYGDEVPEATAEQTGLWPVGGVQDVPVAALGALDRLLSQLSDWCELARDTHPALQWCARMEALLANLFEADPGDAQETAALASLQATLRALREQFRTAAADPELAHASMCNLVDEALMRVPERQPFLLGGITFCGMVPQRSIPFRMIAVLGLNDGEFPRIGHDDGLDLMPRHARIGDRDTRSDDRYLFLETVMAARSRLHLSYQHEGAQDGKPRNPAAPLAELLAWLESRLGDTRPWFVAHPLQPFDDAYFDGRDPRLSSFSRDYAAMVRTQDSDDERFVACERPVSNDDDAQIVPLARLLRYFRDPAADLLRDRLKLRLDALEDDQGTQREPLTAKPDPLAQLPQQLLTTSLVRGEFTTPAQAPDWLRLSGQLPAGALGRQAYRAMADQVDALLQVASDDPDLAHGLPPRAPVAIDLMLGACRVQGTVARVHADASGWLLFHAFPGKALADLDFRQRLPLFIEWALLRLAHPEQPLRVCLLTTPKKDKTLRWDAMLNAVDPVARRDDLEHRLLRLIALWQSAEQHPLAYLPKTAWAAATHDDDRRMAAMRSAWASGSHHTGERDFAPGYTQWLARGIDPVDPHGAETQTLITTAAMLRDLISFSDSGHTP